MQARELGVAEVGVVRLIRAERVPSRCGVVVEALVEGCEGPVMVEPLQSVLGSCGLEMEHMLVEPDRSGKVSIVVANPSLSVVCLDTGQCLGSAHVFEEWVQVLQGKCLWLVMKLTKVLRCVMWMLISLRLE